MNCEYKIKKYPLKFLTFNIKKNYFIYFIFHYVC